MGLGIFFQIMPMSPENMTVYVNGVQQEATDATVRNFRLITLLACGLSGLITAAIGGGMIWNKIRKNKMARRLKQEGVRVLATVTDYTPTNVRINYRTQMRLCCAYTDSSSRTYIFKSGHLRMDPFPYLKDGKVTVYYDRSNMKRYFVDIDGSVGTGSRVVEL